jgi:hypothetical protein
VVIKKAKEEIEGSKDFLDELQLHQAPPSAMNGKTGILVKVFWLNNLCFYDFIINHFQRGDVSKSSWKSRYFVMQGEKGNYKVDYYDGTDEKGNYCNY